ncbi:CidB/LrgB family autolysis modulator [Rodentibacter pneumotropicus]|uniref:CidB/LrgB family autolysis modulator n=1 Tax=Rodentibacter pneumotropicus TaxID=758 RepID=UPI00232DDA0E|nr:CidB/LrgB family autolysis modulator [Rodentibacter pneumotropicus]MDC2824741.1 CidB/LrgB family autolysis modulator [Rodentibacter pneumotropicus]
MNYPLYFYTFLTIFGFWLALQISKRWKSIIFNSFILTVLILVVILVAGKIPYDDYMKGNAPINHLLSLSIVALALLLYEQLRQIAKQWRIILSVVVLASIFSMFTGAILALILGATPDMVATVLPKSITTPIAMEVSAHLGGIPAVTAVGVVLAGLQGSIFGYLILQKIGLRHQEAIGLSVGSISHALGTVSCMEINLKAGSYSSISLVLCGIISSILAPLVFNLIYLFM